MGEKNEGRKGKRGERRKEEGRNEEGPGGKRKEWKGEEDSGFQIQMSAKQSHDGISAGRESQEEEQEEVREDLAD
eukprot:656035-Pyramimonas_sp.AAC.1